MTTATDGRAPLIGYVADRKRSTSGPWVDVLVDSLPHTFSSAIEQAGGVPLMIPVVDAQLAHVERLLDAVDGLFLAGGRDIDAELYGQAPHAANDPALTVRDRLEIELVRAAMRRGMPVLGACRGMQVINVALGGTLTQHLAETTDLAPHRDVVGEFTAHPVRVTPGTRLAGILPEAETEIASHHHQGIDRLGAGLTASAAAPDGVIEALEASDAATFCLGVQWHPEERLDPDGLALMRSLIEAAGARAASRAPART